MKLIHVISISDGNEKDLKITIKSVRSQKFKNYKHIVVAKFLSKGFLQKNKSNKTLFVVGKDKGLFDAMNIGENLSTKNFTIYLNSGDIFFSEKSLDTINSNLISKTSVSGQFISVLKYKNCYFYPKKNYFFKKNTLAHNAFVRSPMKKKIFFNKDLIITADGDWMKRCIKISSIKKIYIPVTIFSLGGQSNLPNSKTILWRKKEGNYLNIFKEILKYILLKLLGIKLFYILIYSTKYNLKYKKIELS
jgi:hypothetical protein